MQQKQENFHVPDPGPLKFLPILILLSITVIRRVILEEKMKHDIIPMVP